jgi:hypothetical protein
MVLGSSKVTVDELIDAAAALATADRICKGQATVTGERRVDGRGLRMEVVA